MAAGTQHDRTGDASPDRVPEGDLLRLERVEARALADFHAAAPASARTAMGLALEDIRGTLVSIVARGGNVVVNRAIGLGLARPADPDQVRAVRAAYARAGVERFFLHLSPAGGPRPLTAVAEAAGLVRDRGWMKFVRDARPVSPAGTELSVREIGPEHGAAFGRIAARGFGLDRPADEVLASLPGRPGWHVFMSFDGDTPAGVGALFADDGVAWTDWAATDPEFRRRGSQSALLAARLDKALALGCRLIGTCTGEAVPGEEQTSYHNILKAGFREAGLRPNYSPAGRPRPRTEPATTAATRGAGSAAAHIASRDPGIYT